MPVEKTALEPKGCESSVTVSLKTISRKNEGGGVGVSSPLSSAAEGAVAVGADRVAGADGVRLGAMGEGVPTTAG